MPLTAYTIYNATSGAFDLNATNYSRVFQYGAVRCVIYYDAKALALVSADSGQTWSTADATHAPSPGILFTTFDPTTGIVYVAYLTSGLAFKIRPFDLNTLLWGVDSISLTTVAIGAAPTLLCEWRLGKIILTGIFDANVSTQAQFLVYDITGNTVSGRINIFNNTNHSQQFRIVKTGTDRFIVFRTSDDAGFTSEVLDYLFINTNNSISAVTQVATVPPANINFFSATCDGTTVLVLWMPEDGSDPPGSAAITIYSGPVPVGDVITFSSLSQKFGTDQITNLVLISALANQYLVIQSSTTQGIGPFNFNQYTAPVFGTAQLILGGYAGDQLGQGYWDAYGDINGYSLNDFLTLVPYGTDSLFSFYLNQTSSSPPPPNPGSISVALYDRPLVPTILPDMNIACNLKGRMRCNPLKCCGNFMLVTKEIYIRR